MLPVPKPEGPGEQAVEFVEEVCGIYFRSILLKKAGTVVPQHVHDHDHATYVGSGAVRMWVDGFYEGEFKAGTAIEVKAGCQHVFQSVQPYTRLACIHDAASALSVKKKGV